MGVVDPDKLRIAIRAHLDLYKLAYGEDAIRFKHHAALHLHEQLRKWKKMLATTTLERKHRVAKRYGRGRMTLKKFETSVLQDITCHSIWELSRGFLHAFSTSKPSRKQLWWLQEIFPDVNEFTLHNEVSLAHGTITVGDVVAFRSTGGCRFGELLMTVGIRRDAGDEMISVVSVWEHDSEPAEFLNCRAEHATRIQIKTNMLIESVACRMPADRKTCTVCLPCILRKLMLAL